MMVLENAWLVERISVPEQLSRLMDTAGIGGRVQRVMALDWLAEQLGRDPDRLGTAAYSVLDSLLEAIADEIYPDRLGTAIRSPRSLIEDLDSGVLDAVVDRATAGEPADTVIEAMIQFGWGHQRLVGTGEVCEVPAALQSCLAVMVKRTLVQTLRRWYR